MIWTVILTKIIVIIIFTIISYRVTIKGIFKKTCCYICTLIPHYHHYYYCYYYYYINAKFNVINF